MLSAYVFVCENVCESPLISIVCLFSILYGTLDNSRAHTCMRPSFLTVKIELYPQCVFSCDCSSSPASVAFLHGFCGSEGHHMHNTNVAILACVCAYIRKAGRSWWAGTPPRTRSGPITKHTAPRNGGIMLIVGEVRLHDMPRLETRTWDTETERSYRVQVTPQNPHLHSQSYHNFSPVWYTVDDS